MKYSIIIATRDRAHHLRGTLASLATIKTTDDWELIVVDNNSVDDTPGVVREMAHGYPAPIRYVYEAVPGRSAALNAGIAAARGQIIATTDDDVRVPQDWLDVAGAALDRLRCHFVGGKVLPIWSGPRPAWLSERGGSHWAVIALLDCGPEPLEFDRRMPLGVNRRFGAGHSTSWAAGTSASGAKRALCSARKFATGAFAPARKGCTDSTCRR